MIPPLPWPSLADRRRCFDVWQEATPAERRELCRIEGEPLVRRLKISEAILRVRAVKQTLETNDCLAAGEEGVGVSLAEELRAAEAANVEARRYSGLEGLQYNATSSTARFSLEFCARPDAFESILERSACTLEDQAEIVSRTDVGHVSLHDGGWESLAREVFTLIMTAFVMRCGGSPEVRGALLRSLTLPRGAKLRSWPSKRELEVVRRAWAERSAADRVQLTTLTGPPMWWCDVCRFIVRTDEAHRLASPLAGDESAAAAGLRYFVNSNDLKDQMFFTQDFTSDPKALDWLLKTAVSQLNVKEELLQAVSGVKDAAQVVSAAHGLEPGGAPSWAGLATLVATLVLEVVVERSKSWNQFSTRLEKARLAQQETERRRRAAKSARKRAARAAAKGSDEMRPTLIAEFAEQLMDGSEEEAAPDDAEDMDADEEGGASPCGKFSTDSTFSGGGDSSATSWQTGDGATRWPSVSELPCARQSWRIERTFIEFGERDVPAGGVGRRSSSCPP